MDRIYKHNSEATAEGYFDIFSIDCMLMSIQRLQLPSPCWSIPYGPCLCIRWKSNRTCSFATICSVQEDFFLDTCQRSEFMR